MPSCLDLIDKLTRSLPHLPRETARSQEYYVLARLSPEDGVQAPYDHALGVVDRLIGQLQETRQRPQELKDHSHEWGDDDYCVTCEGVVGARAMGGMAESPSCEKSMPSLCGAIEMMTMIESAIIFLQIHERSEWIDYDHLTCNIRSKGLIRNRYASQKIRRSTCGVIPL